MGGRGEGGARIRRHTLFLFLSSITKCQVATRSSFDACHLSVASSESVLEAFIFFCMRSMRSRRNSCFFASGQPLSQKPRQFIKFIKTFLSLPRTIFSPLKFHWRLRQDFSFISTMDESSMALSSLFLIQAYSSQLQICHSTTGTLIHLIWKNYILCASFLSLASLILYTHTHIDKRLRVYVRAHMHLDCK
jgi:hypothetical protein